MMFRTATLATAFLALAVPLGLGCASDSGADGPALATQSIDNIEQAWVTEDLGGVVLSQDPSVVGDATGKKLFYAGPNGHLFMSTHGTGPWWSAPIDLGGVQLTSKPAAAITGPNKLKVWYRGPNGHLWMSWFDGGPWWSAPADLGGVVLNSEPSVVVRGTDKLSVFYRGPNNHLWMSTFDGGPWWSAPTDLGGVALASAPSAVIPNGEPTHIRVFYKGPNNHLWMSSYDGGQWWSGAVDLGGYPLGSAPGAVSSSAHGMDVFYSGPRGQLMHSEWTGGPWWSAPFQDGAKVTSAPSALSSTEVYYRGANGHLFVAHPKTTQPSALTASGIATSNEGAPILVTQGLSGNTLVAGKQVLFRLFNAQAAKITTVTLTISTPDGSSPRDFQFSGAGVIHDAALPLGASAGIIVAGINFPDATAYKFVMSATDAGGNEVERGSRLLAFLPTVDMRYSVAIMRHAGSFEPKPEWTTDVRNSMARLAAMLPVRDGVDSSLSTSSCSGVRYQIESTCDGWANWNSCVYDQTRAFNAQLAPKGQQVDLTFDFRWGFYPPDVGDPMPGGNSGRPGAPYSDLRRGSCVSGPYQGLFMTAPCFAQESGHNYGLEPPTSPHYQDPNDNGHSKDPLIVDPYAFDFVKRIPYSKIGDTMNNDYPQGSWMGNDAVLYNAFDWEYLRQQFIAAKTPGATGTGKCGPPAPIAYASLSVTAATGGTVTSAPAGIDCGAVCTGLYTIGTQVTLTATPQSGWAFSGWTGDCAGSGTTCTLTMGASRTTAPRFSNVQPVGYFLNVHLRETDGCSGSTDTVTSLPAQLSCTMTNGAAADCIASFPSGTPVTLAAVAGDAASFVGFSGDCSGASCSVVMSGNHDVVASFCGLIR